MTREEAISIMNVIIHMLEPQYDTDRIEYAVELAIKALEQEPSDDATLRDIFCMGCEYKEQEPCDDVISRQAVLDLAKFDGRDGLGSIIHAFDVEQLPPVTPAEKVGRWVGIGYFECRCSNCHYWCYKRNKTRYCPSCGAKMQEVEE